MQKIEYLANLGLNVNIIATKIRLIKTQTVENDV